MTTLKSINNQLEEKLKVVEQKNAEIFKSLELLEKGKGDIMKHIDTCHYNEQSISLAKPCIVDNSSMPESLKEEVQYIIDHFKAL